jgi:hypothetical protein
MLEVNYNLSIQFGFLFTFSFISKIQMFGNDNKKMKITLNL